MHISLRNLAGWALASISASASVAHASQSVPVRQIAIIGAGAAGSSTAYFLKKFADESGAAVNITIFEKEGRIGGRTLTIEPFGNASQRVELGASIFIPQNHILADASDEFGLALVEPYEHVLPLMGVWDGAEFVLSIDTTGWTWWNTLKILWKYGVKSPRSTNNLVQSTVGKFMKLYDKEFFPFRSLTQRVYDVGLLDATATTGEEFLKKNGVSDLYAHDVVQASTRVNYASNLANIHGLDTMVSMAPDGAISVKGGNWRIFSSMVKSSKAHVHLNTSVTSILVNRTHEAPSRPMLKYILGAKASNSDSEEVVPVEFDNVVIATPFQFSEIQTPENVLQHVIDEIPYVELHVTIFSSPFQVSPSFFNMTSQSEIPGMILTTLGKDDTPSSGVQGAGSAGFFSINILRKVINSVTQREEYLYKIFSPEKITAEFLSRLINVDVEESMLTTATTRNNANADHVEPVSWFYPHVFYSYPRALPRVTFQDPIVGAGLYYTSGMESFISTMETNALMGKNVARLIVDDILEESTEAVKEKHEGLAEEEAQKIIGDL